MQSKAQSNLAKLPEFCFARLPSNDAPIIIEAGARGYRLAEGSIPEKMNARLGVTPAQVEAMLAGSMFGWDVPGADPDFYR